MTFNEFTNWALAQGSVGKATDGQYVGECVSLINQYLSKVHGINAGAWGNAAAWANSNHPIRQWFTPVTRSQAGDIGVSTAGQYGHIWIYRDNDIIEQNGRVARKVTISPDRNATVILRPKAGMPKPQGVVMDTNAGKELYRTGLHREAENDSAASQWNGRTPADALSVLRTAPEWQMTDTKVKGYDSLSKQVSELSSRPTKEELQKVVDSLKTTQDKVVELEAQVATEKADQTKVQQANLFESFVQLVKKYWSK